jgi:hypothetical protein
VAEVSPEVLSKLAELIKVAGGAGTVQHDSALLNYLKVIAELLNAISWPIAAVICALLFRPELLQLLRRITSVKIWGTEIAINRQIEQSAQQAQGKTEAELRSGPSKQELERATIVKELAADTDRGLIAKQAEALAAEYEQVRALMLPGSARTRAMEVVVSKMRTIGQAFFPLRHEFASAPYPGKRLMVIASLQVLPDYDMLDWLAERVGPETPFLQYQALLAILTAAKGGKAEAFLNNLQESFKIVSRDRISGDPDTLAVFDDIKVALDGLAAAKQ